VYRKGVDRGKLRRLFKVGSLLAVPLVALLLEGGLRATGHLASWSEENGGDYVSPYDYRNATPWLLVGEPGAVTAFSQPEFQYEVRLNREGLRDVDHPEAKPPGEFRVVGLGDSFTMGQGAELEDTYLSVLGRSLNQRPRVRKIRVLAGGVAGSDPVFCHQLLLRRLVKYQPDLVILAVNESDVFDLITRGGMDRFDADGFVRPMPRPSLEGLYARSYLARAILRSRFLQYEWDLLSPAEHAAAVERSVAAIVEAARAIQALGREHGFTLLVVSHPLDYQVKDPQAKDLLAPLAEPLAAQGIEFLDLVAYFRAHVPPEGAQSLFWPVDRHCNAQGYALFARGLEGRVVTLEGFPARVE